MSSCCSIAKCMKLLRRGFECCFCCRSSCCSSANPNGRSFSDHNGNIVEWNSRATDGTAPLDEIDCTYAKFDLIEEKNLINLFKNELEKEH